MAGATGGSLLAAACAIGAAALDPKEEGIVPPMNPPDYATVVIESERHSHLQRLANARGLSNSSALESDLADPRVAHSSGRTNAHRNGSGGHGRRMLFEDDSDDTTVTR